MTKARLGWTTDRTTNWKTYNAALKARGSRRKHRPEHRREWHKIHLGIDAQTLEIHAIEVIESHWHDQPCMFLSSHIVSEPPAFSVAL